MNKIKFGLFFVSALHFISAYEGAFQDCIPDDFARYSEHTWEAGCVPLNKSVFIKGEDLGFKAYANWMRKNFFLESTC
jgi:hypothetical protein